MKRFLLGFRNIIAFLAGFAVAGGVFCRLVPPPKVVQISVKLDWMAKHVNDYDIIAVGSSRMRQINPAIMDAELAAAGMPMRTFNLSADGMRPPEDSYVLDQALANRTKPLRYLIVEANHISMRISPEDENTNRLIHWHDNARMWALWRRAFTHSVKNPPPFGKRLSETWRNVRYAAHHGRYWILNSARYGQGADMIQRWMQTPQPDETLRLSRGMGERNDGYVPNDPGPMSPSELKEYNESYARIKKSGRNLDPMDGGSQALMHRFEEIAKRHGARLVIITPTTVNMDVFEPRMLPGSDAIHLDLSDPKKYAYLFEPNIHLNGNHFTGAGSDIYTQLLVKKFIEAIKPAAKE